MLTIDDYCDRAKKLHSLKSDAQLAKKLNVNQSLISGWRTKRSWPSDEIIADLADLSKLDAIQALLYLNVWRSDGKTHKLYSHLADDYLRHNPDVLKKMVA